MRVCASRALRNRRMRAVAPTALKVATSDNAVENTKRPQKVVSMSELLGSISVKRPAAAQGPNRVESGRSADIGNSATVVRSLELQRMAIEPLLELARKLVDELTF